MAKIKKKEEERKQRREEMAKKYPMQNPRTTVTAVLTKKDDRSQIQKIGPAKPKNDGKTDSFVYRGRSNSTTWENYPLRVNRYEPKQQTWQSGAAQNAQTKAFEDREFRNKAATGWQRFQIDESNKNLLRADSTFQRWKEQFGEPEFDDDLYKPAKNWQARDNNTFGFIYSQNKEDAYRYAGILNKAYRQLDEAIAQQRAGGLEAKRAEAGLETANTAADWLKGLGLGEKLKTSWEQHGEAQKNYGEAMRQQSDNTANAWNWLWEQHKTNTSTLANAQAQQAQAQTKGVREAANSEIAQRVMNHFTESMRRQSSNMETVAEQWKDNAYLAGKYSGVTGSDQTGASIHGFRDDTSYKTPNDEWTDGERQLYEFHQKNNPKEAEAYAIRVNDRHNQKKKDEKIQNLDDWMSQSGGHGAVAWTGARGLNVGAGIDGYNQQLELAARGRITANPELSMTDIVTTIDDTNARNLTDKYGVGAGVVYRVGSDVTDAMISRGVNYMPVAKLPNGDKIRIHDVNEVMKAFNEAYLGTINQGGGKGMSALNGLVAVVGDTVVGEISKDITERKIENKGLQKVVEETANSIIGSTEWFTQNKKEIDERTRYYMENRGKSQRTAKWMATRELIERSMK